MDYKPAELSVLEWVRASLQTNNLMFNNFVTEPLKRDLILSVSLSFRRSFLTFSTIHIKENLVRVILFVLCETSICELLRCTNAPFSVAICAALC